MVTGHSSSLARLNGRTQVGRRRAGEECMRSPDGLEEMGIAAPYLRKPVALLIEPVRLLRSHPGCQTRRLLDAVERDPSDLLIDNPPDRTLADAPCEPGHRVRDHGKSALTVNRFQRRCERLQPFDGLLNEEREDVPFECCDFLA